MATDEQRDAEWEKRESLPPYVQTDDQKRRWGLCVALCDSLFDGLDPDVKAEQVWQGARAIYHDPTIPTGDGHA